MLRFNSNGYLTPDNVISTDFKTFVFEFVESVPDENRLKILRNFFEFCRTFLQDLELQEMVIFIDGSFTTKKQVPKDIDLVVFLHWEDQKKHAKILNNNYKHDDLLTNNLLDVYFVLIYPENHSNHSFTNSDRVYWVNQFTRTRPNRRGTIHKKGLLQLTVTQHDLEQI